MTLLKLFHNLFIATIISLTVSGSLDYPGRTETVDSENRSSNEQSQSSSESLDFSGDGRPGRRTGGGSRSLCPATPAPLTALVPHNNIGKTTQDRPRLWFYIPYASQQAAVGEFVLQDQQENDVYRQTFTPPQTSGLVSFELPQSAPPLETNRTYRWYFKLYCGDSSSTANFVEGWIVKVPLSSDLSMQLESEVNPAYQEYGDNSIWFDSLDSLAQLRLKHDRPQLKNDWNQLLGAKGVNLDWLSDRPLVGKVTNIIQNGK